MHEPLQRVGEHVNGKTSSRGISVGRKLTGQHLTYRLTIVSGRSTVFIRFALAAISVLLFAWLSANVMTNNTSRIDDHIRNFVHRASHAGLTEAMEVASDLGEAGNVGVLTLTAAVVFWIQGKRGGGVVLAVTILGAGILANVLKLYFNGDRPVTYFSLASPGALIFPSAH